MASMPVGVVEVPGVVVGVVEVPGVVVGYGYGYWSWPHCTVLVLATLHVTGPSPLYRS